MIQITSSPPKFNRKKGFCSTPFYASYKCYKLRIQGTKLHKKAQRYVAYLGKSEKELDFIPSSSCTFIWLRNFLIFIVVYVNTLL